MSEGISTARMVFPCSSLVVNKSSGSGNRVPISPDVVELLQVRTSSALLSPHRVTQLSPTGTGYWHNLD